MELLEDIRVNIGMDINEFYATLLATIVPFVIGFVNYVKNHIENNLWNLHSKRENDYFFGIVMLLSLFLAFLEIVILIAAQVLLNNAGITSTIVFIIIYILLTVTSLVFLSKRIFIRKRLLVENKNRWLIYIPLIIFSIGLFVIHMEIDNVIFNNILGICMIVIELWGLIVFRGRYVQYKFSSAIFHLNNGTTIDCEDISQISRKYNSLIINEKNKQIRIRYNDISTVEYYGSGVTKILR